MKRWMLLLIITLIILPLTFGAVICEEKLTPGKTCTMLTPDLSCTNYTYEIINQSGTSVGNQSLTQLNGSIYSLNVSLPTGSYIVKLCDDSTRELIVEGEDDMASLSITLFILLSTLGLFVLPFVVRRFSKNKFLDLSIKRGCWIVALYLMVLNSTIIVQIAEFAGIEVNQALYRYMWLFGWVGYVFIMFTFIKTLLDLVEMWKKSARDLRLGKPKKKNKHNEDDDE